MENQFNSLYTELEYSLISDDAIRTIYKAGHTIITVNSIFGNQNLHELLYGAIITKINSKELHLMA